MIWSWAGPAFSRKISFSASVKIAQLQNLRFGLVIAAGHMPHTDALRIIDAALNRAGEGLRVVEDYLRFVLDDPFLTREIKSLRHDLAAAATAVAPFDRHAARDTVRDVGTTVSTPAEQDRSNAHAVCAASLKRAEQALRSLEEYGKLIDGGFSAQMETLRYRLYTLEKAIDVGRSSRDRLQNARLCVLVDGRKAADDFERLVASLVEAGVDMIQLRDKHLEDRELVDRARRLRQLTRSTASLAIVNDRADIAAATDADGVHVGQEDLAVKDTRAIVGARKLVGVSTHNIEEARAAVLDGANYLGAGPTFRSQTKTFDNFAGLDYLRQVAAEIRLPTFAISGVTADNLTEVLAAGITRVAVSAAVVDSPDPRAAARSLVQKLNA
jgi:thiamine-phosphate pyrophosphorylase